MMGLRGKRPTPTPILKLRGSQLIRKGIAKETLSVRGTPERTDWLDEDGQRVWDALVPMLDDLGILAKVDQSLVARYCDTFVWWLRLRALITKHGETYPLRDKNGEMRCLMPLPQVGACLKLATQLTKMEAELGMTPSARSRIEIKPKERENALVDYLEGAG